MATTTYYPTVKLGRYILILCFSGTEMPPGTQRTQRQQPAITSPARQPEYLANRLTGQWISLTSIRLHRTHGSTSVWYFL